MVESKSNSAHEIVTMFFKLIRFYSEFRTVIKSVYIWLAFVADITRAQI